MELLVHRSKNVWNPSPTFSSEAFKEQEVADKTAAQRDTRGSVGALDLRLSRRFFECQCDTIHGWTRRVLPQQAELQPLGWRTEYLREGMQRRWGEILQTETEPTVEKITAQRMEDFFLSPP